MKSPSILIIKFTFLFLLLGLQKNSLASHAVGGEIFYEYIGDSTGIPFHYLLYLRLYRDVSGISFGTTQPLSVSSSCFGNQNVTAVQFPGFPANQPVNGYKQCLDTSSAGSISEVSTYLYRAQLILPGPCVSYKISWNLCCRYPNIDNILTDVDLYLEASLNNTLGNNSSPRFLREGVKVFCLNREVAWTHSAIEPDGDSLYYKLVNPEKSANTPVSWVPGYSALNPVTAANFSFTLNPHTGQLNFLPVQPEVCVFRLQVSEYRKNQSSGAIIKIGEVNRDAMVVISNSCSQNQVVPMNPKLANPGQGGSMDVDCYTDKISLQVDIGILCSSIATDGSDFAIFDSQGFLMPIRSAGSVNCLSAETYDLEIELFNPIAYNDTIKLITRKGTDNNTLVSICGNQVAEFDTLQLTITNCSTSIGYIQNKIKQYSVYPNPSFDHVKVSLSIKEPMEYVILDITGRILFEGTVQDKGEINVSSLAPGRYILRLEDRFEPLSLVFFKL